MRLSEDEWRKRLTKLQYDVLRRKGTEPPFYGGPTTYAASGSYACAACGNILFPAEAGFESTTPGLIGWPAFSEVSSSDAVTLEDDHSYGMHRIEVKCGRCGGHLGHYFDDPSSPNGAHYCVNACVLELADEEP